MQTQPAPVSARPRPGDPAAGLPSTDMDTRAGAVYHQDNWQHPTCEKYAVEMSSIDLPLPAMAARPQGLPDGLKPCLALTRRVGE